VLSTDEKVVFHARVERIVELVLDLCDAEYPGEPGVVSMALVTAAAVVVQAAPVPVRPGVVKELGELFVSLALEDLPAAETVVAH
jgi:hypothetical protein